MENKNILAMTTGNVAFNEEAMRKNQFRNILENAKELMSEGVGKSKRVLTSTAWIPLDMLFVDARYQGLRTHKQINKLRMKFDKRKLTPIIVVPHYEEYRFAICDGQGRWILAPEKGLEGLYAIILMDAPDDPMDRLKFEAEYFIGQNTEVEAIKPIEKHLANVIIGDEPAIIVDTLINKYGIKLMNDGGVREESVLGSYTETYAIAKAHGKECLEFIFSIIENAGWDHETNGYSTAVMRALKEAWRHYPSDRNNIATYLSHELRDITPRIFSSKSTTLYPNRESKLACILYVRDMLEKNLNLPRKYYFNEDTKKIVDCK